MLIFCWFCSWSSLCGCAQIAILLRSLSPFLKTLEATTTTTTTTEVLAKEEALPIPKVSLLMEGAGQQESCFTTREVKRSTKRVLYARLKPFHDGSQRKAVLSQNFGLQSLFDGGLGGMLSAGLPICHIFNVKL